MFQDVSNMQHAPQRKRKTATVLKQTKLVGNTAEKHVHRIIYSYLISTAHNYSTL